MGYAGCGCNPVSPNPPETLRSQVPAQTVAKFWDGRAGLRRLSIQFLCLRD